MKSQSSTRAVVESGILTGLTVVLILFSLYVPVIYMIGIFIWPIPVTFVYIRHGAKFSIMSLVVAGIITAALYNPLSALNITATFGLMSVVLGYCIKNRKDFFFSIVLMSAAMFLSLIFIIKVFMLFMGQDIAALLVQQINQVREMTIQMYSKMGVPKETLDIILNSLPTGEIFKQLLPSALLLGSVMMAYISYISAGKIFERFGYNVSRVKPFSNWYIPSKIAVVIIGLVLISYIMMYFKIKNSNILFINSNIILQYFFMVNGLAAIDFFLKKKDIAKALRIIILIFLFMSQFGGILFLIGIIDYTLNLRKLDMTRN